MKCVKLKKSRFIGGGVLFLLSAYFLLLCFAPCASAQTPELDRLFLTALDSLENSELKMRSLHADLMRSLIYAESLETLSEEQKQTLLEQGANLERASYSLKNINQQLTDTSGQLIVYRTRLKAAIKWVIILAAILLARFAAMIAGYILYAKGVKLPRWVDILL